MWHRIFFSVFFIDNVVWLSVLCYRLQVLFCVLLLWFYKRVITLACLFIFPSLIHVLPSPNAVTNRSWRDLQWPCVWLIIYYIDDYILIAYSTTYSANTYSCLLSEVYKMSASVYYQKTCVCVCVCVCVCGWVWVCVFVPKPGLITELATHF